MKIRKEKKEEKTQNAYTTTKTNDNLVDRENKNGKRGERFSHTQTPIFESMI